MATRRSLALAAISATALAALPAVTASAVAPLAMAGPAARADVNGDGVADIVMSTSARMTYSGDTYLVPNDLGGTVQVVPGGAAPPGAPASVVNQNTSGVGLGMAAQDKFGAALATGDFNGDNLADVAIGNPTETVGGLANAGTVSVLYGQAAAPYLRTVSGALGTVHQGTTGVTGDPEAGDLFGGSLATGDFNGDGRADLAVGSPGEGIGDKDDAGAVWVLFGSAAGLTATGSVAYNQDDENLAGAAEAGDKMGWALAAGDVTGDNRDDLAVLSPGEVINGTTGATGAVHLLHGAATGLPSTGSSYTSVANAATEGKWRALAIGRFHGGKHADLVVHAERRRGGPGYSGAVVAVRGSASGLTATAQVIDQDTASIPDTAEANDVFGGAMAVGDLDGDAVDDLAVGTLKENNRAGSVTLLRGSASGLLTAAATTVTENTAPVNANAQAGEGFGYGLRVLDITGDGKAELLVSAPWEGGSTQTGALFVLDTALSGDALAVTGARALTRIEIGTPSSFGPGTPIAGGTHLLNDNQESPR